MRLVYLLIAVLAVLGALYAASPYYALHEIKVAIREDDAGRLQDMIDWDSVRDGLKQDMTDYADQRLGSGNGAGDDSGEQPQRGGLGRAILGALVPTVIGAGIDVAVTPEGLLRAMDRHRAEYPNDPFFRIAGSHFASLTAFRAKLRHGEGDDAVTAVATLRFEGGGWVVTRLDVPPQELAAIVRRRAQDFGSGIEINR